MLSTFPAAQSASLEQPSIVAIGPQEKSVGPALHTPVFEHVPSSHLFGCVA
jgi:hypothetical protein